MTFDKVLTEINLPVTQPDPHISVIVMEYDQKPQIIDGLVAKTVDGGHSLTYENRISEEGDRTVKRAERGGTIPTHISITGKYQIQWKIFIDIPGDVKIDASYSFQDEKPRGTISVKAAGSTLKHDIIPTGKTVGEPNQTWQIDNYSSNRIGAINFSEKGIYEITLEVDAKKDETIKFQWLWMKGN